MAPAYGALFWLRAALPAGLNGEVHSNFFRLQRRSGTPGFMLSRGDGM